MLVKKTIDLKSGFVPWKEMFIDNEYKLNEHDEKLAFTGTEKDNDNKVTVIMDLDSTEALQNFAGNKELTKIRATSGAKLETTISTVMSSDSFTKT